MIGDDPETIDDQLIGQIMPDAHAFTVRHHGPG